MSLTQQEKETRQYAKRQREARGTNGRKNFPTKASLIWYFLKGSKQWFGLSIVFACLVALADLVNPKIIQYTVDSVIGLGKSNSPAYVNSIIDSLGGTRWIRHHMIYVAILVIGIALLGAFFRYMFKYMEAKGGETLVRNMRDSLFGHIQRLPYEWHNRNHTGDIIQRCTSDVDTVKVFISEQLTSLFSVVLLIVMSLYFMIQTNLIMGILAGVFIPVMVFASSFFYVKIGDSFLKVDSEEGVVSGIVQENLTGVRVVRAFGRESYERERFEKQNENYTTLWFKLAKILASFWTGANIIDRVRNLMLIIVGAVLCVKGNMSPGEFIAFMTYNEILTWPVRGLGRIIAEMSKAGISIERIRYIMNSEEERDIGSLTPDLEGDIEFENITYGYSNSNTDILRNVTFSVKAGSTVGILGETGSGKSTLMYLLDRLYDLPSENGRITIGGNDIQQIKRKHLRENIGMIMQEPYLFSGTIEENIGIAKENITKNEISEATAVADLNNTIESFTQGYDTYVGERGVTLSGGQKQRIAIAQMLVRKSPIMIFDDSLSALDTETDNRIRKALDNKENRGTKFLIAHRITTLMHADLIIVLEKGEIVQRGTHDELLKEEGLYKKIYELQTKGMEE